MSLHLTRSHPFLTKSICVDSIYWKLGLTDDFSNNFFKATLVLSISLLVVEDCIGLDLYQ